MSGAAHAVAAGKAEKMTPTTTGDEAAFGAANERGEEQKDRRVRRRARHDATIHSARDAQDGEVRRRGSLWPRRGGAVAAG